MELNSKWIRLIENKFNEIDSSSANIPNIEKKLSYCNELIDWYREDHITIKFYICKINIYYMLIVKIFNKKIIGIEIERVKFFKKDIRINLNREILKSEKRILNHLRYSVVNFREIVIFNN